MDTRELNYLWLIITAVVIFLFIKLFIFDFYRVKETSMTPSLKPESTIMVFKAAYGLSNPFTKKIIIRYASPAINDIVIYRNKKDRKLYIKRVIALAGDSLETRDGKLYVNKKIREYKLLNYTFKIKKQKIPKGKLFLLGDNLPGSLDSRSFGPVFAEDIIGKAFFTILPFASMGVIR